MTSGLDHGQIWPVSAPGRAEEDALSEPPSWKKWTSLADRIWRNGSRKRRAEEEPLPEIIMQMLTDFTQKKVRNSLPELPDIAISKIMASVPYPNIFRARCLSKDWRSQLSEMRGNATPEGESLFQAELAVASKAWPSYAPILLREGEQPCLMGYDALSRKWKKLRDWNRDLKHFVRTPPYRASTLAAAGPLINLLQLDVDLPLATFKSEVVNIVTGKSMILTCTLLDDKGVNCYRVNGGMGCISQAPKTLLHGFPDGFILALIVPANGRGSTFLLLVYDSREGCWYKEHLVFDMAGGAGRRVVVSICQQLHNDSKLLFHVRQKGDNATEFREFDVLTRQLSRRAAQVDFRSSAAQYYRKMNVCRLVSCGARIFLLGWEPCERKRLHRTTTYNLHVFEYSQDKAAVVSVSDTYIKLAEGFVSVGIEYSSSASEIYFAFLLRGLGFPQLWKVISYNLEGGRWTWLPVERGRWIGYSFSPGLNIFTDPSSKSK